MKDTEIENKLILDLYSDIVNSGGLNEAINEALNHVRSRLETNSDVELPSSCSRIEYKGRSSQIMLAAKERRFSADLWADGVCYGNWWFDELIQVADFIKYFVELRFSVKEMKKKYEWFHSERGELHDKGAEKETVQRWNDIISQLENEETTMKYLLPCVELAKEFTELAVLYPYTSMNTLCFSLTTGFPYLTVGPKITGLKECIVIQVGENQVKEFYSVKELKDYMEHTVVYYGIARQGTADNVMQ